MSDTTSDTQTAGTTDPQSGQPPKDPLAVLEELLAKQKGGAPAAGGENAAQQAPPATDPAAELAAKQAEYERMRAEAAARDAELLAAQTAKMQELHDTPEYQARLSQTQAADDEAKEQLSDQEGYTISQVTTTTVAGQPEPETVLKK